MPLDRPARVTVVLEEARCQAAPLRRTSVAFCPTVPQATTDCSHLCTADANSTSLSSSLLDLTKTLRANDVRGECCRPDTQEDSRCHRTCSIVEAWLVR